MNDKSSGQPTEMVERRSVSMYGTEWAVAEAVSKDAGLNNVSAAIRMIVTEWARMKAAQNGIKLSES